MKDTLKLISSIPPSVNHYLSYRAIMRGGRPLAVSYVTPEANKYKKEFSQYVIYEVANQNIDFSKYEGRHFVVDAMFYFPRRDMDANNYWKVLLDAITDAGLIWKDDNVVCERVLGIRYDKDNPRVELSIYPADYIGIFEDISQLEEFESNCIGCSRYTRNCSVLKGAKDGYMQNCILDNKCSKKRIKGE